MVLLTFFFAGDSAAILVCREKRAPTFGNLQDWYSAVPNTMVTGVVWDPPPLVKKVVDDG